MNINKKLIALGAIGIVLFNPLSANIIADGIVYAANVAAMYTIASSAYVMVGCGTLAGVGCLLWYLEEKSTSRKKLKKLKTAKTQKAGDFIEV